MPALQSRREDELSRRRPEARSSALNDLTLQQQERLKKFLQQIFQRSSEVILSKTAEQQRILSEVPTRVQVAVESPHGKDSIDRCFSTEREFRHVWIYLYKSHFLREDELNALFDAYTPASLLWVLMKDHELVDFRPLRDPIPQNMSPGAVMHWLSQMFTACLLHYNLEISAAVRYVGHIHTGSHRDWNLLESFLRAAQADATLIGNIRRVYIDGCPNKVNAYSSAKNVRAYAEYGNHPSVYQHLELTKKAIQKDVVRQYTLPANPALSPFIPDTQRIPQGMVVLPGKNPRQICDESFHPKLDSMAVNDWTDKRTEPDIIFPESFMKFLTWIWNLRITYPDQEIYIGDDDVSGAFRHAKWNPNVIGMHSFMLLGFLFFATGQTFGGNTCPPNFEVMAISRMLIARYLWKLRSTIAKAAKYLPTIIKAPVPTPEELAKFTPASRDSINTGVLEPDGSRRPPPFNHHVDDCLYADVGAFLVQTISASVLALYIVLGFPDPSRGIRDCVSWEKFQSEFTHQRKTLGWVIDSRRMTVALPDSKRDALIEAIDEVLRNPSLTLRQIAQLLGHIGNATTVKRDMKCAYFNLQRLMRVLLYQRYHAAQGYMRRHNIKEKILRRLPKQFKHRLDNIISQQVASFLWDSGNKFKLDSRSIRELRRIRKSLKTERWEIFIPQLIPRDPHFQSQGDASQIGGGAVSQSLAYWFRVVWSPDIVARMNLAPSDPMFVHINALEFTVVILQVAAAITFFEVYGNMDSCQLPAFLLAQFPDGLPAFPVLEPGTDNKASKSWTNNARTTSDMARALVHIFGQLLRITTMVCNSKYIPGVANIVPDFISRPDQIESHPLLLQQTFQRLPWMKTLSFFQPSPELVSVLHSSLCSNLRSDLPEIPKQLGHFVPAESITSAFVSI